MRVTSISRVSLSFQDFPPSVQYAAPKRNPGCHVSDLLQDLEVTLGGKTYDEESDTVCAMIGLATEQFIFALSDMTDIERDVQLKIKVLGRWLSGSPDGIKWSSSVVETTIHECKCTWALGPDVENRKSTVDATEAFEEWLTGKRYYLNQVKCYSYLYGQIAHKESESSSAPAHPLRALYHFVFMRGMKNGPPLPEYYRVAVKFSKQEILQAGAMLPTLMEDRIDRIRRGTTKALQKG